MIVTSQRPHYQVEALHRELSNQRQQLTHERTRLHQAHYAGAVPLELLKAEQDRITSQLEIIESRLSATSAHFDTVQANLKLALDLTSDCHRAYRQADDHTRRLLNQALFEFIYIDEDGVRAALASRTVQDAARARRHGSRRTRASGEKCRRAPRLERRLHSAASVHN